ncbi:MAG: hypothetical protein MJ177_04970 [Clostridia bacterium]|nr:hypothetical protein [Clostridia bacterium]
MYARGQYHSDTEFSEEFDLSCTDILRGVHLNNRADRERSEKNLTFKNLKNQEKMRKSKKTQEKS